MKLNIEEMRKKEPLMERLVYNIMTGNRIEIEIYLCPLRAIYKVSNDDNDTVEFFDDLKAAIDKFNYLEDAELDAKDLEKMEK